MAKTIKFNLIIDKQSIRDLEDLQDHFNIEDLLGAFHTGSLKRWLEARELTKELAEFARLNGDDGKIAVELCKIFQKDCTKEQIASAVYPFEFRKREDEKLRAFGELQSKKAEIIHDYHAGYADLLNQLKEKNDDYPFIKAAIQEIFEKYVDLFKLDAVAFYQWFVTDCKLVILSILANSNMRPLLPHDLARVYMDIGVNAASFVATKQYDTAQFLEKYRKDNKQPGVSSCGSSETNSVLKKQEQDILMLESRERPDLDGTIINSKDIMSLYPFTFVYCYNLPLRIIASEHPSPIKSFSGETSGYWKDLEPKGKQFLIIKMEDRNFIRNSGKNGEELNAQDINAQFLILDGIDYKSNNASHQLIYMEI
jgi:hypothetical protein